MLLALEQAPVAAVVLEAAAVLQLLPVQVAVVRVAIYFPDRVVLAAVLVMDRVVQVVPLET